MQWSYRLLFKDLWHADKKQDRNALATRARALAPGHRLLVAGNVFSKSPDAAQIEMEAHRALLQQELETVYQEIAAAKREGESATSVQRLFEKAGDFADCLRKFEQPALPHHEGTLVLWNHCA